jgi:hypothetical protein
VGAFGETFDMQEMPINQVDAAPPWSGEETDGGLLVTDVDPTAPSGAPYPAGSVASTAAAAASYQQAHAATAATTTSATTNCTAAAPAAAYVAAAYMAAAAATAMASAATAMASAATAMASAASAPAAPSAASPCKPYAGTKFSFFVENVKGPQAHIKHFLLGEKNSLPRVLGRHVCCRRVCRCTAHHRQRDPGSRPHG